MKVTPPGYSHFFAVKNLPAPPVFLLLMRGTASEVAGIDSDTVFRNTVSESRIVTSVKRRERERERK